MADFIPSEKVAVSDNQIEANPADPNRFQDASLDSKALNADAAVGNEAEHSFGVIQGFKTYKRAAFWSIGTSGCDS
jgi:MFS transporter, SP family, general alpha glucoside:H+ symporter